MRPPTRPTPPAGAPVFSRSRRQPLGKPSAEADAADEFAGMADADRLRPRPPGPTAGQAFGTAAAGAELGDAVDLVPAADVGCGALVLYVWRNDGRN